MGYLTDQKNHNSYKKKYEKDNEKGSVIVVTLLILLILTLAGISAINMSVTESYIIRNHAIHKQNLQLAEMAAREGLREVLNLYGDQEQLNPYSEDSVDWLFSFQDEPNFPQNLNTNKFKLSDMASGTNKSRILDQRGEDNTLWYYCVGWEQAPGWDPPVMYEGKVIGIYNSPRYGRRAVEIGVLMELDMPPTP